MNRHEKIEQAVAEAQITADVETQARQLLYQGWSAADVAAALGLDYDGHGKAVVMPGWRADDGNAEVAYPDATSAREAAQEYVDDGDWGPRARTSWVTVRVWRVGVKAGVAPQDECASCAKPASSRDEDGDLACTSHAAPGAPPYKPGVEVVESERIDETRIKITIEPQSPQCSEPEHDWEDVSGSLRGSGGGVRYAEQCAHCGVQRHTDTWAQDPEDGEQGLRSVSYSSPTDEEYGSQEEE